MLVSLGKVLQQPVHWLVKKIWSHPTTIQNIKSPTTFPNLIWTEK
jgi:hypothetical protein